MSNWATPQARDERNPDQPGSGNFQRKVERGFTIDLNSQAAMWTTPNVPNGGRSLPAEIVEARGMTAKGKRQVGLHNEAELWTTPQAHDAHGGDEKRVRRHGTAHGCANLADDVCGWRPE